MMRRVESVRMSSGFTLIEVMVAILISSIMMIAMYQNFTATQRAYALVQGMSDIQENGRFSLDVLASTLRMTGYRSSSSISAALTSVFPAGGSPASPSAPVFAAGEVLSGTNNPFASAVMLPGADSVSVRYQGGAVIVNCFGVPVGTGLTAIDTFYVGTDNNLHCYSTFPQGAVNDMPLAEGVDDMQILYGIDSDADLMADRYVNSTGIAAGNRLVSMRISLLFNSVVASPEQTSRTIPLLDGPANVYTDGLRRQVFTTTIGLRNMVQ